MKKSPYHSNKVRIIAGTHRSRYVRFSDGLNLRPTADSVRERLFNWIGPYLGDKKILDLFAGSGILAFESASRGAKYVVAIEQNRQVANEINKNKKILALNEVQVINQEALAYLKLCHEKFDIVFLDPPYNWQNWSELINAVKKYLKPNALIYIESDQFIELSSYLRIIKNGTSGKSRYYLVQFNGL